MALGLIGMQTFDPALRSLDIRAVLVFVIPGEDPGSSVDRSPLQRAAVRSGSRLKAVMTKKELVHGIFKLHRAGSIGKTLGKTFTNRAVG